MPSKKKNASKKPGPASDVRTVTELASHAELLEVFPLSFEANRKDKNTPSTSITADLRATPKAKYDADSGKILVDVHFEMDGHPNPDAKVPPEVSIRLNLRLVYRAEVVPSHDALRAFAEHSGLHTAWPYWREFVQSATTRLGLPALTIPVFRLRLRQ